MNSSSEIVQAMPTEGKTPHLLSAPKTEAPSRLTEAVKWYLKAAEKGLQDILYHPQAWQVVEEDIRRHLIKRFPVEIEQHRGG